jgi:hypothetical protein
MCRRRAKKEKEQSEKSTINGPLVRRMQKKEEQRKTSTINETKVSL